MDPALYRRIIADLAEINWDGKLRFIGLNELTMHREVLTAPRRRCGRDFRSLTSRFLPTATF
jgi:hypothetical protein